MCRRLLLLRRLDGEYDVGRVAFGVLEVVCISVMVEV